VALIETQAIAAGVQNTPWQVRLKALGLSQKQFAVIFGLAENTVSRQLRGEWETPRYIKALILALEQMPDRDRWIADLDREG
jgi:transcriptional regulator with XRE-family HTH domain